MYKPPRGTQNIWIEKAKCKEERKERERLENLSQQEHRNLDAICNLPDPYPEDNDCEDNVTHGKAPAQISHAGEALPDNPEHADSDLFQGLRQNQPQFERMVDAGPVIIGFESPDKRASKRALSFVVARVYELEFRRRFKIIPKRASALGTACFGHLPANSFLALLPQDELVKTFHNHVEIGAQA
ncbi:hypothetical protein DFH09DRAFT_1070537 [Mycena vulgaris]|nr:hypothetical protein DFH09DRAFT_1070537 [Mycena vulgaris]